MIPALSESLAQHLAWWGLRRFDSDQAYFQWQRDIIPAADLARLTELAQHKSTHGGDVVLEVAFYDFSVRPGVLAALYSQRYDYYMAVGPLVSCRIGSAQAVLDVGCGPGILTTFYARQFPHVDFLGIDRSVASVSAAQERAEELGLNNVRFERGDVEVTTPIGSYDLILATHALLQAEHDPGVPSADWRSFERSRDARLQGEFERRTGLGPRLDHLAAALAAEGRWLIFEKTRPLARRIPFQRALAARGCVLLEPPMPIGYTLVEEVADDGPFYVLGPASVGRTSSYEWDELPELDGRPTVDISQLCNLTTRAHGTLYENHDASAQFVWAQLSGRQIMQETTREGPDGKQLHVETGKAQGLSYLFCANTFDQRQLVLVRPDQAGMLDEYYEEIVNSTDARMIG
ncbi:MAG: methyltransferase domain-containing protein [Nitrospirales bacterium]